VTSLEREIARRTELRTFVSTVARVEDVAPGLRQVTIRGGLGGFVPLGADHFVYVMVPRPGGDLSKVTAGLPSEVLQRIPEAERPVGAYYTIRRWSPEDESIELWVVLHHGDDGVAGWARRATPGDPAALWGPRRSFAPPPSARSFLLVGDGTGLPAIASILEEAGSRVAAHVVVETADATRIVLLPAGPNVSVTWRFRDGDEPGTGHRLLDAVRQTDFDPTEVYVFGAAEAEQIRALHRHLCEKRRLPPGSRRSRSSTGRSGCSPGSPATPTRCSPSAAT
jgi:NADPH-dependent ferric siderophore reductase